MWTERKSNKENAVNKEGKKVEIMISWRKSRKENNEGKKNEI